MARNSTWTNSDGLVVGYGTHSSDDNVLAVNPERGAYKTASLMFNGVGLPVTGSITTANIPPQAIFLKRGSHIKSAKLVVQTAFTSGGAPTLTIGTHKADATADVAAGILSAAALATINTVGQVTVCAGTLVNGTIAAGATADADVTIVVSAGTATYTAGRAMLVIEYSEPDFNQTVLA